MIILLIVMLTLCGAELPLARAPVLLARKIGKNILQESWYIIGKYKWRTKWQTITSNIKRITGNHEIY